MSKPSKALKEWDFSSHPEIAREISMSCPDGSFLVCRTCSENDPNDKSFGINKSRRPFWISNFVDHLNSARHKKNERRKTFYEEKYSTINKKPPQQTILPWATKTPSAIQISARLHAGIPPSIASEGNPQVAIARGSPPEEERKESFIMPKLGSDDICRGILANQDLEDDRVQGGLKYSMDYYVPQPSVVTKCIEGTQIFSLFSSKCNNKQVRSRDTKLRAHCGRKCIDCHSLAQGNYIRKKRSTLIKRNTMISKVVLVKNGKIDVADDGAPQFIKSFISTNDVYLTDEGLALKQFLKGLQTYVDESVPETSQKSAKFIQRFGDWFKKYGDRYQETLSFNLLENAMKRMEGKSQANLGTAAMQFYCSLDALSPKASNFVSANLFGPAKRNVVKASKIMEGEAGLPIIARDVDAAVNAFVAYHKRVYKPSDVVSFSVSVDASKVASLVQPNYRYRVVVGGASPDHYISIPEEDTDGSLVKEIIDSFKGEKPLKKKASEIKVATVTYQWMPTDQSPFFQFMARPQSKNQTSEFNFEVAGALMKAEAILRGEGYNASFVSCANDGVSCDAKFVIQILSDFLGGKNSFSGHTDANHNVKNVRYQLIIGGNSAKTIGIMLIDPGLLKKASIPVHLWNVKDFASDLIVLELASAKTVSAVLDLQDQEAQSQVTLCTSLFFMRVHLCAVNCNGLLTAKQRVIMLWSSLLYVLHVDGVHVTTKRNWVVECISMCFMIMRSDVIRPHRLTSEPSEHSFAQMRNMVCEFTVNDFIGLVQRVYRFCNAVSDSTLTCVRNTETSGYMGSMNANLESKKDVKLNPGPVKIETNMKIAEMHIVGGDDCNVSSIIWKELMPVLNSTSNMVRSFLVEGFGVSEEHPMMKEFTDERSPCELLNRLKDCIANTDDQLFKGEKRDSVSLHEDDMGDVTRRVDGRDPTDAELATNLRHRLMQEIVQASATIGVNEKKRKGDEGDSGAEVDTVFQDITTMIDKDVINEGTDGKVIFDSFLKVVVGGAKTSLFYSPENLINAMNQMRLGKREKGDTVGHRKVKSLLQRWYGEKAIEIKKDEKETVIERGSVVSLDGTTSGRLFMVFVVWKDGGSKWHPSKEGDNPSWPLIPKEMKIYRLGVREVIMVDGHARKIEYKSYDTIVDGINVRNTYRMVHMKEVTSIILRVNV